MENNKLNEKINEQPKKYLSIGAFVFILGIALNFFNSAYLKPIYVESSTMGNIMCNLISAVTSFMAVLGLVVVSNSMTAMKNAKANKNIKRKKRK